jgi:predicted nucleotidyltransferase
MAPVTDQRSLGRLFSRVYAESVTHRSAVCNAGYRKQDGTCGLAAGNGALMREARYTITTMQGLALTQAQHDTIKRVASQRHARSVRLFGSRVRGEARPGSDIDLLVEMETESSLLDIVAMKRELEDCWACPWMY